MAGWAWRWRAVVAAAVAAIAAAQTLPPPCDSPIYCYGQLLHTVQMARLFNDSKHFVDMSLKHSTNATLQAFNQLMLDTGSNPSQAQVRAFVEQHFNEPGSEFVAWTPPDWTPDPEFLRGVEDPQLEEWGRELVALWKMLGRKISPEVEQNPDMYSQIYSPNPVVVPGGRFREFYYWDSYWTIDGLLLAGMKDTVRGMLENFLQMVATYGMVPNGGRIYYTRRSQPPYLIPMVKLYMDYTNDLDFLRKNIDQLAAEFDFWERERSDEVVGRSGQRYKVAKYSVQVAGPRPESYREDYELAHDLGSEEQKEALYVELKSGAESGWDYSTRWFIANHTNKGTLSDLKVTSIAPVDLNSLLCSNARTLSQFYRKLGNYSMARGYQDLADEKNRTMAELFWDATDGTWYDIDTDTQQKRRYFYLSNIHPIWSGCYGQEDARARTLEKIISYLKKIKVLNHVGGVPTSLEESGEQWDFPNAWAPLQHLVIMGLHDARAIHHEAESLAFSLAEKWVRTNWLGFQQSHPHAMFEKYDVGVVGLPGGGGEYNVQLGFGWSNGVAMRLLQVFGDRLTATTGSGVAVQASTLALLLAAVLPLAARTLMLG